MSDRGHFHCFCRVVNDVKDAVGTAPCSKCRSERFAKWLAHSLRIVQERTLDEFEYGECDLFWKFLSQSYNS